MELNTDVLRLSFFGHTIIDDYYDFNEFEWTNFPIETRKKGVRSERNGYGQKNVSLRAVLMIMSLAYIESFVAHFLF